MAKSLRSKRKRKFRALKRIKHKPKLDAKMKEIAIELTKGDENMKDHNSSEDAPLKVDSQEKLDNPERDNHENNENSDSGDDDNEDVDMETNDSAKPNSNKRATVPVHLLSQRKFRKLKMQQKQKKANKKKKFLKW